MIITGLREPGLAGLPACCRLRSNYVAFLGLFWLVDAVVAASVIKCQ